ncbi:MAG: cupin domain-containing protein [Candidatus Manganitrophaceae bacterium]
MASVFIRTSEDKIFGEEPVARYLHDRGILYRCWGVDRIDRRLKTLYPFCFNEQRALLDLYAEEILELKAKQGYVTQDVVALSAETPNLEELLEKFRREHHHRDDEVRFIVDGGGRFTIRQGPLIFDIRVEPGDLLVVPAYTRHWFDLTEARKILCIRIFKDPAGWEAIYDERTGKWSGHPPAEAVLS